MDVKILSAEEYGVPEKRRRTIFIASKINQDITFPKKTYGEQSSLLPFKTVSDAIKNLKAVNGEIYNHDLRSCELKDKVDLRRLKRIPEGKGIRYERDEKEFLTKSLYYDIDWQNIPEKRFRQTRLQRLSGNHPSSTIMTHRHSYFHPKEHRYISAREAAAIQSFPNDFKFHGSITSQWRQIGNAVPPTLAFHIGKAILKMYRQRKKVNGTKGLDAKVIADRIKSERKTAFRYRA